MQTPPSLGRARPLSPDERRAALIAATLPLVAERGVKVTTRQIAEAAGVAEGTIFRVFPDKESLIRAAVSAAMDPVEAIAQLDGIDTTLPLRARLLRVTEILQNRLTRIFSLVIALRMHGPPDDVDGHRARAQANEVRTFAAVIRVLESDRDQFRLPLAEVVRLLRLLTFSGSHPIISDNNPLTADQIVSVLLDGVIRQPGDPC